MLHAHRKGGKAEMSREVDVRLTVQSVPIVPPLPIYKVGFCGSISRITHFVNTDNPIKSAFLTAP